MKVNVCVVIIYQEAFTSFKLAFKRLILNHLSISLFSRVAVTHRWHDIGAGGVSCQNYQASLVLNLFIVLTVYMWNVIFLTKALYFFTPHLSLKFFLPPNIFTFTVVFPSLLLTFWVSRPEQIITVMLANTSHGLVQLLSSTWQMYEWPGLTFNLANRTQQPQIKIWQMYTQL